MGKFFARLKVVGAMIGFAVLTGVTVAPVHAQVPEWVLVGQVHAAPGAYVYASHTGVSTIGAILWGWISTSKVAVAGNIGGLVVNGVGTGGDGSARYKLAYAMYYTPTWIPDPNASNPFATQGFTATHVFLTGKAATTSSKNGNYAFTYAGVNEGFNSSGNTDWRMESRAPAATAAGTTAYLNMPAPSYFYDPHTGDVLNIYTYTSAEIWSYITTSLGNESHDTRVLSQLQTDSQTTTGAACSRWLRERNGSFGITSGSTMWLGECVEIRGYGTGLGSAVTGTIESVMIN